MNKILDGISNRIMQETHSAKGNVLFAVMQLTGSQSPVYKTLGALHATQSVYSYGSFLDRMADPKKATPKKKAGAASGVKKVSPQKKAGAAVRKAPSKKKVACAKGR